MNYLAFCPKGQTPGLNNKADMDEEKERQKEIDEKLEEAGIDPDDPILDDDTKEELADLL